MGSEINVARSISRLHKHVVFTLAEVLIILEIIGVVAALILPSVIHKYRKKALETQFKTTYSFVNQALVMTKQGFR